MLEKFYSGNIIFTYFYNIYFNNFIFTIFRSWYERNKHIFPASRWEPFDPTKTYDKYTISDKNKKNEK